jgi:hypothetical protein
MVDGGSDEFRTIVLDARRRFLLCFFSFLSFYVYDCNALPHSSLVVMVFFCLMMMVMRRLMFRKTHVYVLL